MPWPVRPLVPTPFLHRYLRSYSVPAFSHSVSLLFPAVPPSRPSVLLRLTPFPYSARPFPSPVSSSARPSPFPTVPDLHSQQSRSPAGGRRCNVRTRQVRSLAGPAGWVARLGSWPADAGPSAPLPTAAPLLPAPFSRSAAPPSRSCRQPVRPSRSAAQFEGAAGRWQARRPVFAGCRAWPRRPAVGSARTLARGAPRRCGCVRDVAAAGDDSRRFCLSVTVLRTVIVTYGAAEDRPRRLERRQRRLDGPAAGLQVRRVSERRRRRGAGAFERPRAVAGGCGDQLGRHVTHTALSVPRCGIYPQCRGTGSAHPPVQ